jgi:hypothetical protein
MKHRSHVSFPNTDTAVTRSDNFVAAEVARSGSVGEGSCGSVPTARLRFGPRSRRKKPMTIYGNPTGCRRSDGPHFSGPARRRCVSDRPPMHDVVSSDRTGGIGKQIDGIVDAGAALLIGEGRR